MTVARGRLVVFEGPEGAGKTTQLRLVCDWLDAQGRSYTSVREPGGSALGNELRRMLLEPGRTIDARAEALLFMTSRAALVHEVIEPALARGELVLADRFFLSTYAYQVIGRGLPYDQVRAANELATGGLVPDLTVLLALQAEIRAERTAARGSPDRIESADVAFHMRVDGAFRDSTSAEWQAKHPEFGQIAGINAYGTEQDVFTKIRTLLSVRLPEYFSSRDAAHA